MSVITIVQRALPFSLWKRKPSKEKNPQSPDHGFESISDNPTYPNTSLRCDVPVVHIAVKQPDPTNDASETDSGSDSYDTHLSDKICAREHTRTVSWASIVRSQCRWTKEQEKQLVMAEKQLKRCQKAWSPEQEVWLAYIQTLSEQKKAHKNFRLMRMRQQDEERNQFRKAWKRRQSESSEEMQDVSSVKSGASGLNRFRRLPLYGLVSVSNLTTESTAVACRG